MARKTAKSKTATYAQWRPMLLACAAISAALLTLSLLLFPQYVWIAIVAILAMGCWMLSRIIR